jgi:ABC-type proline/glycine betaine transport system permease subunit
VFSCFVVDEYCQAELFCAFQLFIILLCFIVAAGSFSVKHDVLYSILIGIIQQLLIGISLDLGCSTMKIWSHVLRPCLDALREFVFN